MEVALKWFFYVYFGARVLINIATATMEIGCTNLVKIPTGYVYVTFIECMIDLATKTITFCTLLYQMYKYNNFEFDRTWKQLVIYFALDIASFSLCIYIYTNEQLIGDGDEEIPFVICYFINLP